MPYSSLWPYNIKSQYDVVVCTACIAPNPQKWFVFLKKKEACLK